MKPYGLRNKFKYNYKNYSSRILGKNGKNWWEVELGDVKSKKTARQKIKKFIKKIHEIY